MRVQIDTGSQSAQMAKFLKLLELCEFVTVINPEQIALEPPQWETYNGTHDTWCERIKAFAQQLGFDAEIIQ